MQGLATE